MTDEDEEVSLADIEARRIAKNPARYDETALFYTIEAIKQIRERYLKELIKEADYDF
jgi:hypothetical protein